MGPLLGLGGTGVQSLAVLLVSILHASAPAPPPSSSPLQVCGCDWQLLLSSVPQQCYVFVSSARSWNAALADCQARNASLATVGNAQVDAEFFSVAGGVRYWIGLNDPGNNGSFVWQETGSSDPPYRNWAGGEPNSRGPEWCVHVSSSTGRWNDKVCNVHYAYVCTRLPMPGSAASCTNASSTPPTAAPSGPPSRAPGPPTSAPSSAPTSAPSSAPTSAPSSAPTSAPSSAPTSAPSSAPTTTAPSMGPTRQPSGNPTLMPTASPSTFATGQPTARPSGDPSTSPSASPTWRPSTAPISSPPSSPPTTAPAIPPSFAPSTEAPTASPFRSPTEEPSNAPTATPMPPLTASPLRSPSSAPTARPSQPPTRLPSLGPTAVPSKTPTNPPLQSPTLFPLRSPTAQPYKAPTASPLLSPTFTLSYTPTQVPRVTPTTEPNMTVIIAPSGTPSKAQARTGHPSVAQWPAPTAEPTVTPTTGPTNEPSAGSTLAPSAHPSLQPNYAMPPPLPAAGRLTRTVTITLSATQLPPRPTNALQRVGNGVVAATEVVSGLAALASLSAAGAAQGPKMARFFDYATCPPDDHSDLGWIANPTGAGKRSRGGGSSANDKDVERRGAMLANLGIVIACAAFNALCGVAVLAYKRLSGEQWSIWDALARVRFPSFSVFPTLFMLQNVLEPAINLVAYEDSLQVKAVSILVVLITAGIPVACWQITSEEFLRAWCVPDETMVGASSIRQFLWGVYKWVSFDEDPTFERRYALIFKDFSSRYKRFLLVEIAVVAVISALSAFVAKNALHCTIQICLVTLVEVAYLAAVCKCKPFIADLDHWYTVLLTTCQVIAVTLALVAMHTTSQVTLAASAGFLLVSAFVMMLKSLFDVYTFVRDRCAERGAKKQAAVLAETPQAAELLQVNPDVENLSIDGPGLCSSRSSPCPFGVSERDLSANASISGRHRGRVRPRIGQSPLSTGLILSSSSAATPPKGRQAGELRALDRSSSRESVSLRGAGIPRLDASRRARRGSQVGQPRALVRSATNDLPLLQRPEGAGTPTQSAVEPPARQRRLRTVSQAGTPPPMVGRGLVRRATLAGPSRQEASPARPADSAAPHASTRGRGRLRGRSTSVVQGDPRSPGVARGMHADARSPAECSLLE
eukprot:TRINITY_DN6311_c0_g1_i1.p1 TRINITY_DN6311_c0_g1~~TRINITY_DN6311_c0_g1_i1.p1  ORF type:complete len:1176 (+),score=56.06 TRINITY_DN6311_c0_g1_i1:97-3528(+)